MLVGRGEVFAELIGEEEEDLGGRTEGKGRGQVTGFFMGERRGGGEFYGVEGGPGHVEAVQGVEVSEFLESSGFGL